MLLILFVYDQTVTVKFHKLSKPEPHKLLQSYIISTSPKQALVTQSITIDKKILTKISAKTLIPTKLSIITNAAPHKNGKIQHVAPKENKIAITKKSQNQLQTQVIVTKQTDDLSKPKNNMTLAEKSSNKLKEHLRKAPPPNWSSEQSLSVMFPKKNKPIKLETWQLHTRPKKIINDIESDGAGQLYNERLTVVNGTCYKVTKGGVMDPLTLGAENWIPIKGCGLKDKVKQRLNASLNKFIGYRKK